MNILKEYLGMAIQKENSRLPEIQYVSPPPPKIDSELHQLARAANTAGILSFLAINGTDTIDELNAAGWAPLHLAASRGTADTVEALVKAGCNINLKNRSGNTALHLIIKRQAAGQQAAQQIIDILRVLLENGADVALRDENNRSAGQLAAYWERRDLCPLLNTSARLPTHSRGFSSTDTWDSGCGDNSDTGGQATRVTDDGDISCSGDNVRRPQSCPADPAGIGADNVTIITLPSDPGVAIKTVAEKSGSSRESESLSPALPCDAGEATNSTLDINTSMGNSRRSSAASYNISGNTLSHKEKVFLTQHRDSQELTKSTTATNSNGKDSQHQQTLSSDPDGALIISITSHFDGSSGNNNSGGSDDESEELWLTSLASTMFTNGRSDNSYNYSDEHGTLKLKGPDSTNSNSGSNDSTDSYRNESEGLWLSAPSVTDTTIGSNDHTRGSTRFKEDQARTRNRSTGYLEVIGGLSRDHQKLLHVYVKKGEEDVLRELLSRPDVDVNGLDEHNQSPLQNAVACKQWTTVGLLLDRGALLKPKTKCFEDVTYCKQWRLARAMVEAGLACTIQHFDLVLPHCNLEPNFHDQE